MAVRSSTRQQGPPDPLTDVAELQAHMRLTGHLSKVIRFKSRAPPGGYQERQQGPPGPLTDVADLQAHPHDHRPPQKREPSQIKGFHLVAMRSSMRQKGPPGPLTNLAVSAQSPYTTAAHMRARYTRPHRSSVFISLPHAGLQMQLCRLPQGCVLSAIVV